ncbi:anti-sigma factor [Corynebacterium sp. HS2168-gen11]|uniref:anti-sigma factor n=1 Tax=Corynebacterium sp. HS2168-gen11 TaxID=2974027 RepID=UPI00216AF9E3|nr:anti-sigma factor [Corynebacterium sp. HS2168-gen11]MCS4536195.1 anti-sigma factor [Corynebacterium sp. HS2168-gen11]
MNMHNGRRADDLSDAELDALLDETCGEFLSDALGELPVPEYVRFNVMQAIRDVEQLQVGPVAEPEVATASDAPAPSSVAKLDDAAVLAAVPDATPEPLEDASQDAVVVEFPLWRRVGGVALRSVAAVALLVVGVGIGRWTVIDSMSDEMDYAHLNAAQDVTRMDSMMNDGNMATLTWSSQMEMAAVTLPATLHTPKGYALQVWKRFAGEVTSVGFYTPDNGALFSFIDAMPMPGLEILITLEPADGSPQPTTEPLLVFTVGNTEKGVEATVTEGPVL